MARKNRSHLPGAFYHVMLRGNYGQSIFFSDADRYKFTLLVQEAIERFNVQLHGFCWMSNHVHMIFRVSENQISLAIQNIAFRYTRYINHRKERKGHLFQGRFRSDLVEDSKYLLELIRYVHLNPVRAGIVTKPEEYYWSGHRAYLGLETISWLTQEHVLMKFDPNEKVSRERYRKYINYESSSDKDLEEFGIEISLSQERAHLVENFIENISISKPKQSNEKSNSTAYTLNDLIDHVCRILEQPSSIVVMKGKDRIGSRARSLVAYFIKQAPHLTLQEFANYVERDISCLSKPAREIELKLQKNEDDELAGIIEKIKKRID